MALAYFKYTTEDGTVAHVKETDTTFFVVTATSFKPYRKEDFQADGDLKELEPSTQEEYVNAWSDYYERLA